MGRFTPEIEAEWKNLVELFRLYNNLSPEIQQYVKSRLEEDE